MNMLNQFIINEIKDKVRFSKLETKYRVPLVGFADANNPLFRELKTIISEEHYLTSDLLVNAKTVVSFFIPFNEELVYNNLKDDVTTSEWAYGKKDTEGLINEIIDGIRIKLGDINIKCSSNPGKGPYDQLKFIHRWSQKHVAYICGLGNFGLNNLLITESGCAGRFGSFIIDREVDYNSVVSEKYCFYKYNKSCGVCVKNCPSGALGYQGLDKAKCSKWINDITEKYFEGVRIFRSCGKCIALPCALKRPTIKIL